MPLARCHDHKFDPVPTRDYYRIQAVFAPLQFADREAPFLGAENTSSLACDLQARPQRLIKEANKEITQIRGQSIRRPSLPSACSKERGVKSLIRKNCRKQKSPAMPLRADYGWSRWGSRRLLQCIDYSRARVAARRIAGVQRLQRPT